MPTYLSIATFFRPRISIVQQTHVSIGSFGPSINIDAVASTLTSFLPFLEVNAAADPSTKKPKM
jgi:hypothetical protein